MNPGHPPRRSLLTSAPAIIAASLLLVGCVELPSADAGILTAALLFTVMAAPWRLPVALWLRRRRMKPLVILGAGPMAAKLVEEIDASERCCDVVIGVIDDEAPTGEWASRIAWLGPPAQLAEIVERVRPSRIVVAVADRRDRLPMQLLLETRMRGIIVEDALEFYERLTGKVAIEALKPSTLIASTGFQNFGAAEIASRVVSLVGAAIGLLLSAPLLLAIAVLIKLDSRGPVMFVQDRAGKNGRAFGLLKFRTMHPSAEHPSEWVRDNAHRITRVGRWLRRFRFDEVPQLVNVLKGEMNLVGPRPHPTSNHQIFMDGIAYYGLRSMVRPGVTGWAQVRYGYANNLEEETEKMRYDLFYIKNRSLALDARILVHTVMVVLGGQGATNVRQRAVHDAGSERSLDRARANDAAYLTWLIRSRTTRPAAGRP